MTTAADRKAQRKARLRQEDEERLATSQAVQSQLRAADQEVQRHLDDARRSLRRALDVCVRASRGREARLTPEGRRARGMMGRIGAALQTLDASPRRFSMDDPDLVSEDAKYPGWHRREK